jgi:outer membrane protein assembly factor BamB
MTNNAVRTKPAGLAGLFLCALLFSPGLLEAQNGRSGGGQAFSAEATPVGAAPIWEQDIGDSVRGTPFLQVSSAVLACDGGSIKSYFMSGTELWTFTREKVVPFIARSYEGISYVCNTDGLLRAINRVGREVWRLNLGKPIAFPPVIGWDGRVFIPVESTLSCRTVSGRAIWSVDLGSPLRIAPILDHAGSVVSVLANQDFVKIHQFSSVERIRLDRMPVLIVPLNDGGRHSYILFYSAGETEKITFNESAPAGSKLSRSRFASLPAPPAAAAGRENHFAVTLRDGRVLGLDGGSGATLWTANSHEALVEKGGGSLVPAQIAMLFDERGVYSITTRGVTGFAANGRRRFILKYSGEASGIPALSDEGLLYVCGKDNKLHTYKLDTLGRTIPRSKYYGPEPEGSYGMGNPPPSPWAGDNQRYEDTNQNRMYAVIERAINSGQLGVNEPDYVAYLMEMVGFFLNDPHYSPARPAVKPPERVKFIKLLGQIGSRETVPFLWNIYDRDPEPAIRIACAEAIGAIGVDPGGRSLVSYNFLLTSTNPNRDQQLMLAATSSITALCRFVGPPLAGDGLRILRAFMNQPSFPNHIKSQVRLQVDALYREGLDREIR